MLNTRPRVGSVFQEPRYTGTLHGHGSGVDFSLRAQWGMGTQNLCVTRNKVAIGELIEECGLLAVRISEINEHKKDFFEELQ